MPLGLATIRGAKRRSNRLFERIGRADCAGSFTLGGFNINLCEDHPYALIEFGFKVISAGDRGGFVESLTCWFWALR